MDLLYKQIVLNYYNDTKNRGLVENPTFFACIHNPLCGDQVSISGLCDDTFVSHIKFDAKGCVLSQASAAMITECAQGKSIEDLRKLNSDFVQQKLHVSLGPTRLRCVLLALEALHKALKDR